MWSVLRVTLSENIYIIVKLIRDYNMQVSYGSCLDESHNAISHVMMKQQKRFTIAVLNVSK